MWIQTHMCIHTYMHAQTDKQTHVNINMHTHKHAHIYTHIQTHTRAHTHTRTHTSLYQVHLGFSAPQSAQTSLPSIAYNSFRASILFSLTDLKGTVTIMNCMCIYQVKTNDAILPNILSL